MRTELRWIGRVCLFLVGLIAGCFWKDTVNIGAYGVPTPPRDPTVTIEEFSYTPTSPVARDAKLMFSLRTNKPTDIPWPHVVIGDPQVIGVRLNDSGTGPDAARGDGIWSGEWQLTTGVEPGFYPVTAKLDWFDGDAPLEATGEPLIIEELQD